jgi:hypothetical protein
MDQLQEALPVSTLILFASGSMAAVEKLAERWPQAGLDVAGPDGAGRPGSKNDC